MGEPNGKIASVRRCENRPGGPSAAGKFWNGWRGNNRAVSLEYPYRGSRRFWLRKYGNDSVTSALLTRFRPFLVLG